MKKKENKAKTSLSMQFAFVFASLMILAIIGFILINTVFLEKFYLKNKETVIKNAYKRIAQAADESQLDSDTLEMELDAVALKYNISVIVVDVDSRTVNSAGDGAEAMRMAIWDKIFTSDRNMPGDKIIEKTDAYQLLISTDRRSNVEYIEMWGFLSNDNIFLVRSPIQSIEEAARITNLFLAGTGAVVILIGVIVVFFVSRRVAKPILELAHISEKMGELDFDVRYNGKEKNEIGLLGSNINRMSQTLENTISELKVANVELQKDIEKKEKLEEMRSEFVSNVSHELKTPIALIQGYAEGLVEGISEDKESRDYYCSVICDEADKMNTMVKKLLTLNELEFGSENINMDRFDIVTLIRNRIQSTELLAKQKEFDIIFSENNPIYVWGDEFKAEEVLTNYISNAINHCDGDNQIIISLEKNDKTLKINVFNTGEKIPEESIEHVFEKFYKVDKARTRDYGGSGIGLSIVKAIQDAINQKYGVVNEDNGVSFWFEMELA